MSGVKTHTIRIWEQRYGILRPRRTDTNIRCYEDDDLQLLLHVALLNRHKIKISKIATMTRQEIADKVNAVSEVSMGFDAGLDVLTLSVVQMDEFRFMHVLDNYIQQLGFERAMLEVIFPFLEKLGLLWLTGSIKPVQENFVRQLIRNKLIAAIEREPPTSDRKAPKFLLYQPQGEQQELSILFLQYLLRSRKFRVVNIGYDRGLLDLKDAWQIHRPDYVFTVLSENFTREPVQPYLDKLAEAAPGSRLLLTGYRVVASPHLRMPASAMVVESLGDMIEILDGL